MNVTTSDVPIARTVTERIANSCLLCRETGHRAVWTENGYTARSCNCGVIYTDPLPLPGEVDPTADRHSRDFYRLSAEPRVRWLRRFVPTGHVIEVGCGAGDFLRSARRAGYTVSGIEAHEGRAHQLRDELGIEVEFARLEESRCEPKSADIVYHCDLLSHFDDPIGALTKMATFLRPGGVLYFEVGDVDADSIGYFRLVDEAGLPAHRWFYSSEAIMQVLNRAGLKPIATRRFGLGLSMGVAGMRRKLTRDTSVSMPRTTADDEGASGIRPRVHDLLRYGVGRWTPWFGPGTTYFIASPL